MSVASRKFPVGLRAAAFTIALLAGCLGISSAASAAEPHQALAITSLASPSRFSPGDNSGYAAYTVTVTNTGAKALDGSSLTITDELPSGVEYSSFYHEEYGLLYLESEGKGGAGFSCTPTPTKFTCSSPSAELNPGQRIYMFVGVTIAADAPSSVVNHVSVSGGGAAEATATETTPVGTEPVEFGYQFTETAIHDVDGSPFTQAAGHPNDFYVAFQTNNTHNPGLENPAAGSPRHVVATLPKGMVVDPKSTPVRCTEEELEGNSPETNCPDGSVVGVVHPTLNIVGFADPALTEPLYNMVPAHGQAALLGFNGAGYGVYIHLVGGVNSAGEYQLTANTQDILQFGGLSGFSLDLWGSPTAPSHDPQRGGCAFPTGGRSCPVQPVEAAFLTMPSACSAGPLTTEFAIESWQEKGRVIRTTSDAANEEGTPTEVDGCNKLEFLPTISAQPTTNVADSPTGLEFNLHQPQDLRYEGQSNALLKEAKVSLPEGVSLNPSAGNGLEACTNAQIGYQPVEGKIRFSEAPQSCPDAAKIGTAEVKTPLLDNPLPGAIYLAKPYENPLGSMLAIYLVTEDEISGITSKLAGKVEADPQTGRLTTTFSESPELPLEDVSLRFFGGTHAALKSPLACGNYTTTSDLTPWSSPEGRDSNPSDSFQIVTAASGSGACPTSEAAAPNTPTFTAGTLSPAAGAFSPFSLRIVRTDGTQRITGIDTTLPEGLLGRLAGVPYCSEADIAVAKSREAPEQGKVEQASPACPVASEVGSVQITAGAGISPLPVTGHVYLAGPYKGGPLSLVVITPAVAGPFDLGDVVTRVALFVNETTAQLHAVSDPLPAIIDGIPLDVRTIELKVDRPNFTLNPTSCDPKQVIGTETSLTGSTAPLLSPFQVGGCSSLNFKPKLGISFSGAPPRRGGHPKLHVVVTAQPGEANIGKAAVTLPSTEFLENAHIRTVCTRVQYAANACPQASVYGFAKAWTPLLDKPLEGPVYLRSSSNKLPDLVASLNGQIHVSLDGRIDSVKRRVRNSFEVVPDAPVSKFELTMQGKGKGLLVNNTNLCQAKPRANAKFAGQNGKVQELNPLVKVSGCGKGKGKSGKKKGSGKKK